MNEQPKQKSADRSASILKRLVKQRPHGRADKYSLNLHVWLRRHGEHYRGAFFSPWSSVDGSMVDDEKTRTSPGHIYIGLLDGDGYLMGGRLSEIITNGAKANTWAFSPKLSFVELPNFWENYEKDGKCSFDPDHWLYFDKERYQLADDGKRTCLWCGRSEILHVFKEVVERQKWLVAV